MTDIKNENPPLIEENSEETLKRLEKSKKKIERSSTIVKGLGVALPVVAGIAWQLMTGRAGMMEFSALAAFPVVTAVVSAHALLRDSVERKIEKIKKNVSGSYLISSILSDRKMRQKLDERNCDDANNEKCKSKQENNKEEIEKEKHQEAIFSKAADLAKQNGEEETIGRLMATVNKYKEGDTFKYTFGGAIQSFYSLFVTPVALEVMTTKNDPLAIACAAAASVTIPAVAYCAAKTVQSIKRKKNAEKAFKILEKYANERT